MQYNNQFNDYSEVHYNKSFKFIHYIYKYFQKNDKQDCMNFSQNDQ